MVFAASSKGTCFDEHAGTFSVLVKKNGPILRFDEQPLRRTFDEESRLFGFDEAILTSTKGSFYTEANWTQLGPKLGPILLKWKAGRGKLGPRLRIGRQGTNLIVLKLAPNLLRIGTDQECAKIILKLAAMLVARRVKQLQVPAVNALRSWPS